MNTISVNYRLKWELKTDTKYKWSVCGKLFNTQTGRMKKKVLNGNSIGYWIGRDFITLDNLRKDLQLISKQNCPF
jgi:hypothetical protein